MTTYINIPKEQIIEGATLMAFVVEPQPYRTDDAEGCWVASENTHGKPKSLAREVLVPDNRVAEFLMWQPKFLRGTIIVPSEEWFEYEDFAAGETKYLLKHETKFKLSDIGFPDKDWQPASTMPHHLAENTYRILGLESVKRVQAVNKKEVIRMKFCSECLEVAEGWDLLHPNYPWAANPWIELYKVEVVK